MQIFVQIFCPPARALVRVWGGGLLLDVEVEVGGEGEVLLLATVEVHVPAQLGQQQQLARLSTANINTGIIQGVRHNCGH